MKKTRLAVVGAGFWARYQVSAWTEVPGCEIVAIADEDYARAKSLAALIGIPEVFDDAEVMLRELKPDLVDIITTLESHESLVKLAAKYGVSSICQKPFAPSVEIARSMHESCAQAGVSLAIHENFRWQRPIRALAAVLESNVIGDVFRARIDYCNSFPVFDNQPNLKSLDNFIIADMGSHIYDIARFLFGEYQSIFCTAYSTRKDIRGEDVATSMLLADSGATVLCNMSYGSRLEHDRFPETIVSVEGTKGSVLLDYDYWLSTTTEQETVRRRIQPDYYSWADSRYEVVHSSMVACNSNILQAFQDNILAETHGLDNIKTMQMIDAAYQSVCSRQLVSLS